MNNTKKRATVLMVSGAVIGAVAVGVYFLQDDTTPLATDTPPTATSTPSIFDMEPIVPEAKVSTEGWKTCRNEEYGYEFMFPGEWKIYGNDALGEPNLLGKRNFVRESEECNGASVFLSAFEPWTDALNKAEDGDFHVSTHFNASSTSEYLQNIVSTQNEKRSVLTHISVDNHASILQADLDTSMYRGRGWRIQTVVNDNEYWLSGGFYDEQINTIETILSTFRFLNIATSTTSSV